jgi:peptidoglycan/LPS O-acetylase OafA/YrhL
MLWSREGRHFVFANLTLVRGVALGFTGVFGSAPWKEIVNGSLWTMTYEIRLYLSLVGLWWMLLPLRSLRPAAMRLACLLVAAGALAWHATTLHRGIADPNGIVDPVPRLVLMFYLGAAWWVLAEKVTLDLRWLALGVVAVVLARFAGSSLVFHLAYALALPYAIWVAAFVPAGAIRGFNRIGDCSYGIYIYAFPIQQAWAVHFASKGPWAMMAATGTVAIVLGLVSWHFLEKPAMALKDRPRQLFPRLFGA